MASISQVISISKGPGMASSHTQSLNSSFREFSMIPKPFDTMNYIDKYANVNKVLHRLPT